MSESLARCYVGAVGREDNRRLGDALDGSSTRWVGRPGPKSSNGSASYSPTLCACAAIGKVGEKDDEDGKEAKLSRDSYRGSHCDLTK